MTDRQTPTTTIQTQQGEVEYARVKDRLLEAHKGSKLDIQTVSEFAQTNSDGDGVWIVFRSVVTTEKGVFTGQSLCRITLAELDQKLFEKHETIAVGRALAFAGYLATGEIASAEEMGTFKRKQDAPRIVTQQEVANLKTAWFNLYKSECEGLGKEKISVKFRDWVHDIVREPMGDLDKFQSWTPEQFDACMSRLIPS